MKLEVFFLCLCVFHARAFFSDPRIEPHEVISQECLSHAARGSCEFYQCMENRFPCGHGGFSLHYGLHFCNRLVGMMDDFNLMGQKWLNGTQKCLTTALLPVYNAYATRCGDIKDAAIDSMMQCNARTDPDGTNFCSFIHQNSGAYSDYLDLSQISRIIRLRSPRDAGNCGATHLQSNLESISGRIGNIVNSLRMRLSSLWD